MWPKGGNRFLGDVIKILDVTWLVALHRATVNKQIHSFTVAFEFHGGRGVEISIKKFP